MMMAKNSLCRIDRLFADRFVQSHLSLSISRQRDSVSLSKLRFSIRNFHFALITCINAFAVYIEIKVIKYHYNNLLRSYRKIILIGPMESSMYK